jgi:hypothetical protein
MCLEMNKVDLSSMTVGFFNFGIFYPKLSRASIAVACLCQVKKFQRKEIIDFDFKFKSLYAVLFNRLNRVKFNIGNKCQRIKINVSLIAKFVYFQKVVHGIFFQCLPFS